MIEIDFTKKKLLKENWMRAMASWNKTLLKYMYGDDVVITADITQLEENEDNKLKFVIRGEEVDVRAYARAIVAEKHYLDDFVRYGKDHPKSQKTKELLDQAVDDFEQTTGITWPFKDEE